MRPALTKRHSLVAFGIDGDAHRRTCRLVKTVDFSSVNPLCRVAFSLQW